MYFLHKPQSSALHRVFHPEAPSFLKHETRFLQVTVSVAGWKSSACGPFLSCNQGALISLLLMVQKFCDHHLGYVKPVNNEINYQPQLVNRQISSINSTLRGARPSKTGCFRHFFQMIREGVKDVQTKRLQSTNFLAKNNKHICFHGQKKQTHIGFQSGLQENQFC